MIKHKIRSVNINVCSVEQREAYNIAFGAMLKYSDFFDKLKERGISCKKLQGMCKHWGMLEMQESFRLGILPKRIDRHTLQKALNRGVYGMIAGECNVSYTNLEGIGKYFPC